jgi:FtsZ-interacting cell division protein ZipA
MNDIKTILIIVFAVAFVVFLVLWLGEIRNKGKLLKSISEIENTNKQLKDDNRELSKTNSGFESRIKQLESERQEAYRGFEQTISKLQSNREKASSEIDDIINTVNGLEKAILKFLDMVD